MKLSGNFRGQEVRGDCPHWVCDAGCQEPWLLSLLGATDLAGNPRVFGKGIDIGAYEYMSPRGFSIKIR